MSSSKQRQHPLYSLYRELAVAPPAEVFAIASRHPIARRFARPQLSVLYASARRGAFENFCSLVRTFLEQQHSPGGLKRSLLYRGIILRHRLRNRSNIKRVEYGVFLAKKLAESRKLEGRFFLQKSGLFGDDPGPGGGSSSGSGASMFSKLAVRGEGKAKPVRRRQIRKSGKKMLVSKGIALEYEAPILGARLELKRIRSKKAKRLRSSFIVLTPQMVIKPSADERNTFLISVFLDNNAPDVNAKVEQARIQDTSRTGTYKLGVELNVSRQFRIVGEALGMIEVNRSTKKSKVVDFKIRRTGTVIPAGGGLIEARIYNGDHPCGRISKRVGGKSVSVAYGKPKPFVPEKLPHQDAIVEVQRYDGQSGYRLCVKYPGVAADWMPLLGAGRKLEREIMKTFGAVENELGGNPTIDFLRGVGRELFLSMPANFKALVNLLLKKKDPTLIVYSDEGIIPWELLVRSAGTKTDSLPIGAQIIMARWITDDAISLKMPPKLDRAFVSVASPKLAHADREADQVKGYLPRSVVKDFKDGHVMCKAWAKAAEPIIHYIGHGKVEKLKGHALAVSGTRLSGFHIMGNQGLANRFASTRPLVFLNACMAGQAPVKYLGAHGLPQAFISQGASAVVSPNWEVGDGTAADISRRFYAAFRRKNKVSMARVLRDARRLSYRGAGNQTWAAYSFFGHPAAHGN